MKKSDQILEELDGNVPEYIRSVGSFQYDGHNYTLVDHYRSETYLMCEICGHERIVDVYVVKDDSGKKWIVGNVCIDKISNQKIKDWFATYKEKRDNVEKNAYLIDKVSVILDDYDIGQLPIYISNMGIDRLRKMLDRMCKGLDPLEKTVKLAYYYINKIANAS